MRFLTKILALSLVSTPVLADGWGQFIPRTGSIYSEILQIRMNNGQAAQAKVEYSITALYQIIERGNAHGGNDTRKCYFNGQPGTLTRTITLIKPDGSNLLLGSKQEALPAGPNQSFEHWPNDNCGKHFPGDFDNAELAYIGSKAKWQSEIDADAGEVRNVLSLIGAVGG